MPKRLSSSTLFGGFVGVTVVNVFSRSLIVHTGPPLHDYFVAILILLIAVASLAAGWLMLRWLPSARGHPLLVAGRFMVAAIVCVVSFLVSVYWPYGISPW